MTTPPTTSGTGNGHTKGPSSPSDSSGENEHAVRLVGHRAAETKRETGAISRVATHLGVGVGSVRQ